MYILYYIILYYIILYYIILYYIILYYIYSFFEIPQVYNVSLQYCNSYYEININVMTSSNTMNQETPDERRQAS